jgi:TolB-like protein
MKTWSAIMLTLFCLPIAAQKPLEDGITDLARQITTSASSQQKQRIAVLPFRELDGQATVLGMYVAEELVTNLFQLGNFKIVERQLLDKVMGELKIQQSGAIDPTTAKEIGRIAAVDAIVTGSITDFESFIAVHCRLIDTTTGEVFGAAQAKITKDEDLKKIMRFVLTPEGAVAEPRTTHERAAALITKDLGPLRVTLKSLLPVTRSARTGTNGIMSTFEFLNREARRPITVALNAHAWDDNWTRHRQFIAPLRASLLDERGGTWTMSSAGLGGMSFVRAGVHGRDGREAYSPTEIVRLLRMRDALGRDHDDPTDGTSDTAGRVSGYREPGDTSPRQTFFPYEGNRFISGSMIALEPGESITVTMTFDQEGPTSGAASTFQFNCEIVVGLGQLTRSYALHNLSLDRISMPKPRG